MNRTIKRVLSALVIIISITAVIIIAFSNPEMKNAWKALASMDLKWVLGLFLCWAAYAGFEGCGTWSYLRSKGYRINLGRVIGVALIGFYYSNITPSAAGGQPMQPGVCRMAGNGWIQGKYLVDFHFRLFRQNDLRNAFRLFRYDDCACTLFSLIRNCHSGFAGTQCRDAGSGCAIDVVFNWCNG